jgi:poly(A) polymerase/tRNA nucleotidyltransferase (CCA-adding enzyme)
MTFEDWQREIMERGELFRVGGAVRDALLGTPSIDKDVDYVVRAVPPEELEAILSRHGRVAFVGKSFGVYKFKTGAGDVDIDIAYPRTEVSTGPGHRDFDVRCDWMLPVEADLARRDFTINAIAESVADGRLVDPSGGRRDIEARILRMVFPEAFREDPLRILRGVRFAARFALRIDEDTFAAMKASENLVDTLSAERIQEELTKLLTQCDRPSEGFETMRRTGVLARVLPELDRAHGVAQNEYHTDDVFWHSVKSCDHAPRENLAVRWAALLHDLGKVDRKQVIPDETGERIVFYGHETAGARMAARVLERLRYSNEFVDRCSHLVENHMFLYQPEWNRSTVRRFIRRVGKENLGDLFALRAADCLSRGLTSELQNLEALRSRVDTELGESVALRVSDLAVDGDDVKQALGVGEGQVVGEVLRELLERVVDDPSLNTRETLLDIVRRRRP